MIYHERIKELREDRDKTQKEIEEYLNISQNTYSQYERDRRGISVEVIIKLANYYDVSADYILGLTDKK